MNGLRADGAPFKKQIRRLIDEASAKATALGHRLSGWSTCAGEGGREEYQAAFCPTCKGGVSVTTRTVHLPAGYVPAVLEPGIHGSAVSHPCGPNAHVNL